MKHGKHLRAGENRPKQNDLVIALEEGRMIRDRYMRPKYILYDYWEGTDQYVYIEEFQSLREVGEYIVVHNMPVEELFLMSLEKDEDGNDVKLWCSVVYSIETIPVLDTAYTQKGRNQNAREKYQTS